jgi:hypothetical protein
VVSGTLDSATVTAGYNETYVVSIDGAALNDYGSVLSYSRRMPKEVPQNKQR